MGPRPAERMLAALVRVFARATFPGWCSVCGHLAPFTVHCCSLREGTFFAVKGDQPGPLRDVELVFEEPPSPLRTAEA